MNKRLTKRVFVAAKFGPNFHRLLEAISQALSRASDTLGLDLQSVRPDESPSTLSPRDTILGHIKQADLIIADVSGPSPNVLWEIGYAHGLGKPTLLLSEQDGDVPFDVSDHRFLLYRASDPTSNIVARLAEAVVDSFQD